MSVDFLEVYADVWCPFAHVGLREAAAVRRLLDRPDVSFVVRPWPLELVNGAPLSASVTARHVRELREQVAPELFQGFDERSFPVTTRPALALAELAYSRGLGVGEAVSFALRDALFEDGRDIAQGSVLEEIAKRHDLDLADALVGPVRASWRSGEERGVKGSPHFFCQDIEAFCPALDIQRDVRGDLVLRRNVAHLEVFLRACFAN